MWINVKNRLPTKEWVLVALNDGDTRIAYHYGDYWQFQYVDEECGETTEQLEDKITYWMPLPEQPD